MTEEIGAQVPEGSRELAAIAQDGIQGDNEFIDLGGSDREGREDFKRIQPVRSHLRQNPVAGKEGGDHHLREEVDFHLVEGSPAQLRRHLLGLMELNGQYQPLSADFLDDGVPCLEFPELRDEEIAHAGGVLDQGLVIDDLEGREPGGHGEIVAAEGGGMDDTAIQLAEGFLVNVPAGGDGADGDVPAAEGLGEGDDVGLEVPMLEAEPFAGPAEPALDLVGNEEGAMLAAEGLDLDEEIAGGIFDAFALDGLEDDGGDVAAGEEGFDAGKIADGDAMAALEVRAETVLEMGIAHDGQGTHGKAVEGAFQRDEPAASGGGAGELDGALHGLGAGVTEEDGIEMSGHALDERLGEDAAEEGAIHLDHVGEVEIEDVAEGLLNGGMIATDIEDAVAAEEIEVFEAVEVVQVSAAGVGVDFVEADGALDGDEGGVDVPLVQVVILPEPFSDELLDVDGHAGA